MTLIFQRRVVGTSCWDDGTVDNFLAGYGSKHDTTLFIIGFCDDCLDKLIEEKII